MTEDTRVLPVRILGATTALQIPAVLHKGPDDTDAQMFRRAADNLEEGYSVGGGNVTRAVVELVREVAAAVAPTDQAASAMYRTTAYNLENGYPLSETQQLAAVEVLREAAAALDADGRPDPEWSFHGSTGR